MTAIAAFTFFALCIGAQLFAPSEPAFVDGDAGAIASYFKDGSSDILAANVLYLVSVAIFFAFAGGVYSVLRKADRTIATIALGGAVAGAALMIAASTANTVAALRVEERGEIDPQVATVMWDLQSALFGLAAPTALSAFVLALAVATLRTGVLPRWLGFASAPLGVALIIPPISYVAMIAFIFWVPVAGAALLAQGREHADARAAAIPASS